MCVRWILAVNFCQAFAFTTHTWEGERGKEGDEQEDLLKGTENKWSGRKNKTHGREKKGQIRWGVRKWDERSVREGQGVKVSS